MTERLLDKWTAHPRFKQDVETIAGKMGVRQIRENHLEKIRQALKTRLAEAITGYATRKKAGGASDYLHAEATRAVRQQIRLLFPEKNIPATDADRTPSGGKPAAYEWIWPGITPEDLLRLVTRLSTPHQAARNVGRKSRPLTNLELQILHEAEEHVKTGGHVNRSELKDKYGLQWPRLSQLLGRGVKEKVVPRSAGGWGKPRQSARRSIEDAHDLKDNYRNFQNYLVRRLGRNLPDIPRYILEEAAEDTSLRAAELHAPEHDGKQTNYMARSIVSGMRRAVEKYEKERKFFRVHGDTEAPGGFGEAQSNDHRAWKEQEKRQELQRRAEKIAEYMLGMHQNGQLTERQMVAYLLRAYGGLTLSKTSALMGGISEERVRQIQEDVQKKMEKNKAKIKLD